MGGLAPCLVPLSLAVCFFEMDVFEVAASARRSFASGMYITTRKPECHALGPHTTTPKQQQTLSRMDWPVAHWSQAWWLFPRTEVTAHFSPSRMPFLSSPAQQLSLPWPEGSFKLDCTHLHYQAQNHRFFCWSEITRWPLSAVSGADTPSPFHVLGLESILCPPAASQDTSPTGKISRK